MRFIAAMMAILIGTPCAAYGQSDSLEVASNRISRIPAKGATNMYGFLGFGTQALADLNSAIEDDESVLQGAGIPVNFDTFGPAIDLGGGIVHQVSETIGLGIELGYQRSSVNNRYSDVSGSYSDAVDLEILDVTGALQFWVSSAPGLLFGTNVGVGFGAVKDELHLRNFSNASNNVNGTGQWSGAGFIAGVFGGYHFTLSQSTRLLLHAGYRYRNLGEFDGGSGPPSDNAGQPLDFDFSGFYSRLGLGFAFGGESALPQR